MMLLVMKPQSANLIFLGLSLYSNMPSSEHWSMNAGQTKLRLPKA